MKKPVRLHKDLFIEGRLDSAHLAEHHIKEGYFAKSARCRDCVYTDNCDGRHINQIRSQGLKTLVPQSVITQPLPEKEIRIKEGISPQRVAQSLPGYAPPSTPPRDPLAILGEKAEEKRAARRAARLQRMK